MAEAPIEYGIKPPDELFELADSVRAIIERMMVIDRADPELQRARLLLNEIAERLRPLGRRNSLVRMMPSVDPEPEDLRPYFAGNARRWHYNPIHPPMQFERVDGVLRVRVTLGLAYEGPPGCAHGGLVALLLDQVLGQSNFESGMPAMTAMLTIKYRRPTPLLQELVIEADPPEITDNRKCITRGRIRCGDQLTAEGQGLFVLPNLEGATHLPMMRR